MLKKIKLYIISLMLLMVLVVLSSFSVPVYIGNNWEFCGWDKICTLNNGVALVALFVIILGVVFLCQFKYHLKKAYDNLPTEIIEIEDLDQEYLSFFFTLISCLIVDFNDWNGVISFVFILIIFGILFVRTDWFYANPCFALLGFHIYKIKTSQSAPNNYNKIAITKDELKKGDKINSILLSKNVLCISKYIKI